MLRWFLFVFGFLFIVLVFFFFSSRRRHTRCLSDWSSDVCSSDLGVRARFVDNVNGIRMHVLEAGFPSTGSGQAPSRRPAVLLVHGFPELAYSWRKVMLPLAAAGYHVVAPDLRGYGRTGGTDVTFDDDLSPWRTLNEVTDMVGLMSALGYRQAAVVGHDFGSPVAAWCAVVRPDLFRSVVMM